MLSRPSSLFLSEDAAHAIYGMFILGLVVAFQCDFFFLFF